MIDPRAPINASWERYRDTVLMPMDADAIETACLAWFCAAAPTQHELGIHHKLLVGDPSVFARLAKQRVGLGPAVRCQLLCRECVLSQRQSKAFPYID
jgi:hypothetical protein